MHTAPIYSHLISLPRSVHDKGKKGALTEYASIYIYVRGGGKKA